ncbi:2-oxo acid dehydrogenase subunit E2 [Macrococcus hajekii]|uniref:Dihydrolipoamide acetyltransferase component of pyruvate dehydrogenase complex n=1 Tax=Macrococcus hajekii TaxID=198482 RepID=A0A4R6BK67_9STAP|nr:dihydrolipoamide acetyltransferase family protein [Macrococcus hajekii]TDM01961.1 2-oxo acid dehydrogenase subunit E2 [Macrococcus hajekii]GGB08861.1 dihydrolipoamide acetyltransferase component of pyruvate dehydrogenase complex [Macrococcus hajekii]
MAIKTITLPGLGESVTEASISNWLVKPGDIVERYQPIAEATSDKVTTDIPSDFAGIVKELLVELDTDIAIHEPIMTIEVEGTEVKEATTSEATETAMIPEEKPAVQQETVEAPLASMSGAIASNEEANKEIDVFSETKKMSTEGMRYSPAVLKISQERGIDLSQVKGTGRNGRITRKDVLNFTPSEQPAAAENQQLIAEEKTVEAPAPLSPGNDTVVKPDGVRKAIAKRMVQSVNEIPHAWLMVEADVTELVKLRNAHKDEFKKQEGISLSFYPFFIKAVVQALKKHPKMNASWVDNEITYFKDINISVAVATDEHLFVPVIKNADEYSVMGIAKEVNRLAQAARNHTLKPEQMQGGTITVNNTGSFGSVMSQGIINYPQAAILQIESINKRVVPTDDGGFKFADMINLCLSIDHRILDGLAAGRFLADVKENLKQFKNESDIY